MDQFNRLFQKSTENITCQLYSEISRLVRLYASNLLKMETTVAAGNDFTKLSFANAGQLEDENLGLGNDMWAYLSGIEEEYDPKPLFKAVCDFYVASLKKMLKKFPFGNSILRDLDIINPDKFCSYSFSTVEGLAKRFPQLGLADSRTFDLLREEFMDFKLSPANHSPVSTYNSATDEKPKPGAFWYKVGDETLDGQPQFPSLTNLMAGVLSIPASTADSERGFSILRKIHTDQRPSLQQSTIVSLMSIKFNYCHDTTFSSELLVECKKATLVSLNCS